jgi:hypothetical protein
LFTLAMIVAVGFPAFGSVIPACEECVESLEAFDACCCEAADASCLDCGGPAVEGAGEVLALLPLRVLVAQPERQALIDATDVFPLMDVGPTRPYYWSYPDATLRPGDRLVRFRVLLI